jgi:tetratricopeptide (TPR) repeat protein
MLKPPEFEETRLAHSEYLQIWSETGTVGFALFALLCCLFVVKTLKGMRQFAPGSAGTEPQSPPLPPPGGAPLDAVAEWRRWHRAGLLIGAAALVIDYFFVGTFKPPSRYVSPLLQAAPWLVYVIVLAVWAAAFHFVHGAGRETSRLPSGRGDAFLWWGALAAMAAFLLHSSAEVTLRVPALGATAFALGALLLAAASPPPEHKTRLAPGPGLLLLLVSLLPAMAFAVVAVPRALDYSLGKAELLEVKTKLIEDAQAGHLTQQQFAQKNREILDAIRKIIKAVPWDDDMWDELARYAYAFAPQSGNLQQSRELIREAESAARRAIELNSLKARNRLTLATILEATGKAKEALTYYRRAVELHPSLPEGWLTFAEAAERVEGLSERVCDAYAKALELSPRQYHERNRLSKEQKSAAEEKLKTCSTRRVQ